jgi:hypothetical protein
VGRAKICAQLGHHLQITPFRGLLIPPSLEQ